MVRRQPPDESQADAPVPRRRRHRLRLRTARPQLPRPHAGRPARQYPTSGASTPASATKPAASWCGCPPCCTGSDPMAHHPSQPRPLRESAVATRLHAGRGAGGAAHHGVLSGHGLARRRRHRARARHQPGADGAHAAPEHRDGAVGAGSDVGARHRRRAGAGLRRRHAAAGARAPGGVQMVVWSLRRARMAALGRPGGDTRAASCRTAGCAASSCWATSRGSCCCSTASPKWQVYFFRGNGWSNAQSSGDTAPPARRRAARRSAQLLPIGVRLVLAFGESSGLTRDLMLAPQMP